MIHAYNVSVCMNDSFNRNGCESCGKNDCACMVVNRLSVPVRAMEPRETLYIESALEIKLGWLNAETYDINMPCVMCSQTCLVDGLQCCTSVS